MATQTESGREAVRRLFRLAVELRREGVTTDGPAFRDLCREVERDPAGMTEEQMRERLLGLALVASELEC